MLYLLRSYTKDGSILKVGYAKDYEFRLFQYTTHNPGIEEVAKRDGELVDETILHLYLHNLGYNVLKDEWYRDCQEVIDIFNSSLEDMKRIVWENRDKLFSFDAFLRCPNGESACAYKFLLSIFGIDEETEIDKKCRENKERIEERELKDRLFKAAEDKLTEVERILKNILSIPFYHQRMKYIYELDLPSDIMKTVLDNMSDTSFAKYYWKIPKSRASALKYQKGNLEGEYNKIDVPDVLEEETIKIDPTKLVVSSFIVGEKYTKFYIKSELKEIYSNLGIEKTAKANDLEEYFEIKPCTITNKETGKRDNGFEIIKKKD